MIGGVTRRILPHLPGVPHLHVNRPQKHSEVPSTRARIRFCFVFRPHVFGENVHRKRIFSKLYFLMKQKAALYTVHTLFDFLTKNSLPRKNEFFRT